MPVMLFTKPCLFLSASKKAQVDKHGCIELTEVNADKDEAAGAREYKELDDDGNDNGAIND